MKMLTALVLLSCIGILEGFLNTRLFHGTLPRFARQDLLLQSTSEDTSALRKNVDLYQIRAEELGFQGEQNTHRVLTKPEVLAPAGGWPQLKAAVANGCDACYFGLQEGFNARARASNFAIDELEEVMNYLHDRGAKGYLVINILVYNEELEALEKLVKRVAASGVDALIMQDIGAVNFVRKIAPHLPIHGSTQMSITDAHGTQFARSLGIDRVVLGRELSIDEIDAIHKRDVRNMHSNVQNEYINNEKTMSLAGLSHDSSSDVEIEAFVHGALCVSYSGQCFSSEAWGGRSANRGQCAQACRMPYGLIVNGTLTSLRDDVSYLLSPQDLMAVDYVPELIKAGVKSFKIEGRLKGPEYVAITTRAYRDAVDEAWELLKQEKKADPHRADAMNDVSEMQATTRSKSRGSAVESFKGPDKNMRRDLAQVFSRGQDEDFDGLSAGFLQVPVMT